MSDHRVKAAAWRDAGNCVLETILWPEATQGGRNEETRRLALWSYLFGDILVLLFVDLGLVLDGVYALNLASFLAVCPYCLPPDEGSSRLFDLWREVCGFGDGCLPRVVLDHLTNGA